MEKHIFLAIGASVAVVGLLITAAGLIFKSGKWKGEVDSDRKAFKEFMDKIEQKIEEVLERLPSRRVVTPASPLQLTDFGKEIAEEIEAEKWAEGIVTRLTKEVKGKGPYDIQQYCFEYVGTFEFDEIKDEDLRGCAYMRGIELDDVKRVLPVVLRDRLLSS